MYNLVFFVKCVLINVFMYFNYFLYMLGIFKAEMGVKIKRGLEMKKWARIDLGAEK